jgi:proteasome accessory factor B
MYKRGEYGQVARAMRVLDALRGYKRGRWVTEVGKEVGVSERTVRRDLAELQDAGFDIEVGSRDGRVVATLIAERTATPIAITRRERFSLLAVRRVFDVLQGTPFLEDVRSVFTKLEQRMSDKERAELASFGERFVYMPDHGTKSYAGKEDIIDAIQTGILSNKVVRYRYADARGRSRDGHLAPLAIALYRHGLYTIGARLKAPDAPATAANVGIFAIERFTEAEHLRAHTFAMPLNFKLSEVLHGSFGPHLPDDDGPHEILIEFAADKAAYVTSRTWHDSQRIEVMPDGAVRVSMRLPALGPVRSWVLEWGIAARALAPNKLVEWIADETRRTADRYASRSHECE